MTLSLNKLVQLLEDKELIPKKYYRYDNQCIFIEAVSINYGINCLVYIPSRFQFELLANSDNTIDLELIDGTNLEVSTEMKYDKIKNFNKKSDIHNKLENKIDIINSDNIILNNLIKQCERLEECVEDLDYFIAIREYQFLVFIRNGVSDCYKINNDKIKDKRLLYVTITLPTLYQKNQTLNRDIIQIQKGYNIIFEKNLKISYEYINDLLLNKGKLLMDYKTVMEKKKKYLTLIDEYEKTLNSLSTKENLLRMEREKNGPKIDNCIEIKKNIIKNLIILYNESNNLSLKCDNILFENGHMLKTILNNINNFSF